MKTPAPCLKYLLTLLGKNGAKTDSAPNNTKYAKPNKSKMDILRTLQGDRSVPMLSAVVFSDVVLALLDNDLSC